MLRDLQLRVIHGIAWISLIGAPVVFALTEYLRRSRGQTSWMLVAIEVTLLCGAGTQLLGRRQLSIRQQGCLFMSWNGLVATLAMLQNGPLVGAGIAWACGILLGVFLVGRGAGTVMLGAYVVVIVGQIFLIHAGVIAPPHDIVMGGGSLTLVRIGIAGFIMLLICLYFFSLIQQGLLHALEQMQRERELHEAAREARRQVEDKMKANQHFEALGQLTGGVVHDVNNSLTTILCSADLLRYTLTNADQRRRVDDILLASRAAAQTTRQLLSLNRSTTRNQESIDPAETVGAVSRLMRNLLPENIEVVVERTGAGKIFADPADLQQALVNLAVNARDALSRGGVITLRTEDRAAADGSGPQVVISVSDNGTGISPEILPRIFEPFFTTKEVGKGTGLGLAMVKTFVDEVGGRLEVQSAPGRGTRIQIVFPETRAAVSPAVRDPESLAGVSGLRILLIEDHPELRQVLELALERGGFTVVACASCDQAITQLDGGIRCDLLCVDGISGRIPLPVLLGRFRETHANEPVLVCTGNSEQELAGADLAALKIELLKKPFTGTELLARLRELGRSRAR